jgi:hypothetical protein
MVTRAPGAGRGAGLPLGERAEVPAGVHDPLDESEEVEGGEGRAGEPIDADYYHHIAGSKGLQQP